MYSRSVRELLESSVSVNDGVMFVESACAGL